MGTSPKAITVDMADERDAQHGVALDATLGYGETEFADDDLDQLGETAPAPPRTATPPPSAHRCPSTRR